MPKPDSLAISDIVALSTPLFLNTFIATALSVALVWTGVNASGLVKRKRDVIVLVIGTCYSFLLVVLMTFVLFARRHLMVWAIFAPKFVAESCTTMCVFLALALGKVVF